MSIPTELPKPPDVTHPPHPGWAGALWRGFTNRCPCCGTRGLRAGFLRLRPRCDGCGLELGGFRADDAPPVPIERQVFEGQTLTVQVVNGCLGVCDRAPFCKIDGEYAGNLTTESLNAVLQRVIAGGGSWKDAHH